MAVVGSSGVGASHSSFPSANGWIGDEQDIQETLARVSVCNLNQWALDFEGNLKRVVKSIELAKAAGSKLRVGSELEVPGYGCEDHFLETDTITHSWECVAELLASDLTDGILCDIGVPAAHKSLTYNCRVWILNRRILLVRPKMVMADDLNPIGSISKIDLKSFLRWAAQPENLGLPALRAVVDMPPTAELRPVDEGKQQTDEEEMGMTYEELGWFGRLRKASRCGPFSMLKRLLDAWRDRYSPSVINQKVQYFFRQYARNRHKMCTITPALHVESYNPDDNRFDLRPFLYPNFSRQFLSMDRLVLSIEHTAQDQAFTTSATRASFSSSCFPSPMASERGVPLACSSSSDGPFSSDTGK